MCNSFDLDVHTIVVKEDLKVWVTSAWVRKQYLSLITWLLYPYFAIVVSKPVYRNAVFKYVYTWLLLFYKEVRMLFYLCLNYDVTNGIASVHIVK